jgi:plastocyanin
MNRFAILALSALVGLAACSKKDEPAAHGVPGHPGAAAGQQLTNTARVVQVLQAGSYTYIEAMGETGERVWMAGAQLDAKPGDSIQWGRYSTMQGFEAKSLGRKFDRILFVEAWSTGGASSAKVAAHGAMPAGAAMPAAGMPAGHPAPAAGAPASGGGNSGQVKSATSAGGYSYLEVQQGNGAVWLAVPETKVKAGDKVSWDGGSVMHNFTAKSLGRTFNEIVFAGGVTVVN